MRRGGACLASLAPAGGAPAPRQPRTPEGAVVQQILDGLRAASIPAYKIGVGAFPMGTRFVKLSTPGLPDILALPPGRGALMIEAKSPRGRLTPEQQLFRDSCRRAGVSHVVARGWDDLTPFL